MSVDEITQGISDLDINKEEKKTVCPPVYVSIQLSGDETESLKRKLIEVMPDTDWSHYETQRGGEDPGHVTLVYFRDLPRDEYVKVVDETYRPQLGTEVKINVVGFVKDEHCITAIVDPNSINLPIYPEDKAPHITMMLHEKKPFYSNELIAKKDDDDVQLINDFDPFVVKGSVHLVGTLKR